MAKADSVRLRKPSAGPDTSKSPKAMLHENPSRVVVISTYRNRTSVKQAAGRVNLGYRKQWPNDVYYAAWGFDETTEEWQLWIGLRTHLPEGWRKFVDGYAAPRSRATTPATDSE